MSFDALAKFTGEFQDAIDFLKLELSALRTGRATPALVENVQVEVYGARTPLVGLASIAVPDSRTIVIEPWDKNILKDIEKGITEAKINLNPVVQGKVIRITIPVMTEETRRQLVKTMSEKLEQSRIAVRGVRENARAEIIKTEKEGELTEDEKYRLLEQLDKVVAGWNDKIKQVGEDKEKEIMTI